MTALKLANFAKLFSSKLASSSSQTKSLCPPLYLAESRRGARTGDLKDRGIEWRYPRHLHFTDPEALGDLAPYQAPRKTRPVLEMAGVMQEYDRASPIAQRLLSLEFAPPLATLQTAQYDLCRKVQMHQHDWTSRVAQIAKLTAIIRFYQQPGWEEVINKKAYLRRYVRQRVFRRRRMVARLRKHDYKLFEYVLEKLDLRYTPIPERLDKSIEKDESLRKLVNYRCDRIRKRRMEVYKEKLEKEREGFFREKEQTLRWIKNKELELGLPVTVDPEQGVVDNRAPERPPLMDPDTKPLIRKWARNAIPHTMGNA